MKDLIVIFLDKDLCLILLPDNIIFFPKNKIKWGILSACSKKVDYTLFKVLARLDMVKHHFTDVAEEENIFIERFVA